MNKVLFFLFLLALPAMALKEPKEINTLQKQRIALLLEQKKLLEKVAVFEKTLQELSLGIEKRKTDIKLRQQEIIKQLPLLVRLGRSNSLRLLADPHTTQHTIRGLVLLRSLTVSLKHRVSKIQAELNELGAFTKDLEIKTQEHRSLLQTVASQQAQMKSAETKEIEEWKQEEEKRLAGENNIEVLLEESQAVFSKKKKKTQVATTEKGLPFRRLEQPVVGKMKKDPKLQKKFSPKSQGIIFETKKNAAVRAPSKGKVVFKGPFRSQEEILIIDHGKNVHTVFMGMHKISAEVGQNVYAGEKLGTMAGYGKNPPLLYLELRQDGKAINPEPYLLSLDVE